MHGAAVDTVDPDVEHVLIPKKGLRLPQKLAFERWLNIGRRLSEVNSSSAWCLGDWLTYGEDAFTGRYRDAIEQTSLDYQTLRNYAWVSRRFGLSRRRDNLSFGHHAEVAALPEPEQEFWLRKAEDHSWSRNRLRREVRTSLRERSDADAELTEPGAAADDDEFSEKRASVLPSPIDTYRKLEIRVPKSELELYESEAQGVGLSVEEWALSVLSGAASQGNRSVTLLARHSRTRMTGLAARPLASVGSMCPAQWTGPEPRPGKPAAPTSDAP